MVEKCHPYYKGKKNLAEQYSYSGVFWGVELGSDKNGYLAEEVSKQNVERMAWFLLTAYSKM